MSSPLPVDPPSRILLLDALRGFALCGILFINIFDMGGPLAMDRPMAPPAALDPDWQVWTIAQLFVTGTMRGLFSMLFGIGLLLFVGDADDGDRMRLYLRRLLLLLLFGIVDSTLLLWPGDILIIYALAGVIALAARPLKPYQLLTLAGILLTGLSIWGAIEAHGIAPAQTVYSPAMIAREGAARLGGYWRTFDYMSYVSWHWTANLLTYRWVADAAAFMLVGMALFKKGGFGPGLNDRWPLHMVRLGYGLGIVLRLFHVALIWNNDGAPSLTSALLDQPGRLAMTIGHIGLFLILWRRGARPWLMARFAQMGRMALTLYLGQSVMAALIFYGVGLGLWNRLNWPALWLLVLPMLAVEASFAAWWFGRFRYGPMEWLWRWGTYGRRP